MLNICAFTSICEEDAGWLPQYIVEAHRLRLPFVMHFDRCSATTKRTVRADPLCVGTTEQNNAEKEFKESHKQRPFDLVAKLGYQWAMAWDIDETYEASAPSKIAKIAAMSVDYVDITWVNLWNDPKHIRVDGPFSCGHRVKFYNLQGRLWRFTHAIINGPKLMDAQGNYGSNPQRERTYRSDLVCIHWGMMTHKLRVLHKERWDRIYTKAVGNNPYGFWNYALEVPAVLEQHDYF